VQFLRSFSSKFLLLYFSHINSNTPKMLFYFISPLYFTTYLQNTFGWVKHCFSLTENNQRKTEQTKSIICDKNKNNNNNKKNESSLVLYIIIFIRKKKQITFYFLFITTFSFTARAKDLLTNLAPK